MKMRHLCPKYDKLYAQGNSVGKTLAIIHNTMEGSPNDMYTVNGMSVDMLTSAAKHDRTHLYFYIVGPKTRGHLQREF